MKQKLPIFLDTYVCIYNEYVYNFDKENDIFYRRLFLEFECPFPPTKKLKKKKLTKRSGKVAGKVYFECSDSIDQ